MKCFFKIIPVYILLTFLADSSFAQVNDAGLWLGLNAKKK